MQCSGKNPRPTVLPPEQGQERLGVPAGRALKTAAQSSATAKGQIGDPGEEQSFANASKGKGQGPVCWEMWKEMNAMSDGEI